MERIANFISSLMAGGTMEIVLLIVLIVVALILLLVGLWLLWKLLGLLGRAVLWLFDFGGGQYRSRSAAHKEAQRSRPPLVSTSWGRSGRVGLRRALAQARRLTSDTRLCIVVVAGDEGAGDLCHSLGLTPPPVASIGIAAGGETLLIDATRASRRELRRLARALPWRRPVDGIAVLANADGLPADGISRAADFARAASMCVALHIVLPSRSTAAAWRVIDMNNHDGGTIFDQLAADTARIWLADGERGGLQELALAQTRGLPGAIGRALAVAPSSLVDVASVGFSGAGLRGAVAQTVTRTRPSTAPGVASGVAYACFAVGIGLMVLTVVVTQDRSDKLSGVVSIAKREAAVPWTAQEIAAVPNRTRMHRLIGISQSLSHTSDFSPLSVLAPLIPNHFAPRRLGAILIDSYLLRPMGSALESQAIERLAPSADIESWLEGARAINDWITAWEALGDDPREVDVRALLAAAFGGAPEEWPEDADRALIETEVDLPLPSEGGFDVAAISEMARSNFNLSARLWGHSVYTNGPVGTAARRVSDSSANWRLQHAALLDLRAALQDPGQSWLTAAEDRSDHATELRLLGRALASGLVGQAATIEAKANIARIRIDSRNQIGQFNLTGLGALLTRSSQNSGSNLQLSSEAAAWLKYLDKVASAGFAEPLPRAATPVRGVVTVDSRAVAKSRERLRTYDRFAADLPAEVPSAPARALLAELSSELVLGVVIDVENATRPDNDLGLASARAERRAAIAAEAMENLAGIETWLLDQHEQPQADRVNHLQTRLADSVLVAAMQMLEEEDPLGVHIDPTADKNAMVRRFDRGLTRLQTVYQQLAQPFLPVASSSSDSWVILHWQNMAMDLDEYARGNADSAISTLEGGIRAWTESPESACEVSRPHSGRGDYLARAAARFHDTIDSVCNAMQVARVEQRMEEVVKYHDTHTDGLWPFATNGPEVGSAALAQLIGKLHDSADILAEVEGQLAATFSEHASFWAPGEDATVRFKVQWRWRTDIESLAHHVAEVRLEGVEIDEAGVHVWRYGEPFSVHLRLAKNSPYQFRSKDGQPSREWVIEPEGQGAFLRALDGVERGEWMIEVDLVHDESGEEELLRLSGRILHHDDRPLSIPSISAVSRNL